MKKIRFCLNQMGLAVEYFDQGDWRLLQMVSVRKLEALGGAQKAKKIFLDGCPVPVSVEPAGDYSADGCTVTVI